VLLLLLLLLCICAVQLQGVMYPLLSYATNLSNPEAEVLVEEALKCWGVALAGALGMSR
jgi:hypothetical protein